MAFFCNEHRYYSRMAEEEDFHVPTQPTYTASYCNEQRTFSRFAEEEEIVKVEKMSPPTTTLSMCNEQRVFVAEWESIQDHPVYGDIVPALAAFCNEHRSFSRFAEEYSVVKHTRTSSPVAICNEQRAYSRIAEDIAFSQRIFEAPAAMVPTCNEGRAFSRISEEISVSLASEVFEPVTPVSVCGEHRSFPSFDFSASPERPAVASPPSNCNEHRAINAFASENITSSITTSAPVPCSLCNEHRQAPCVFQETHTEETPLAASTPACSEHRAYFHAIVKPTDEPEVVASQLSEECVGPFGASAPSECVSKFFAGEKVSTGLRQSESLQDSFVWFAVVAKASGTLVHVRFLDHLKRHPAVVGTHVFASSGANVKAGEILAVVRLTADTVEEVLEYSDALLHTVVLPLTGTKGVNNGGGSVEAEVALTF